MKIKELMQDVRDMDLVLPEFQREYVWKREQAKQLIDSLLKGYPTGSLLVWKTSQPPAIKNNAVSPDSIGNTSVLLDGQQRLTTLYLLTQDEIPPYYRESDITEDPRGLYFHLGACDLQYYQAQRMGNDPAWVRVTDCFRAPCPVQPLKIARAKAEEMEDVDVFDLGQAYQDHLTALQSVLLEDYPTQTVPSTAGIDDAIDVFDRVNSLGTKLSAAELALAHVTGKWPAAREDMKRKIEALGKKGFTFDLTFMVRALTAVVRCRALFETIHDASYEEVTEGWKRLGGILDYLVTMLPAWAHVHSTDDLSTTNVLVTPVAYLAQHGGKFPSETEVHLFVRWLYAAATWARYTSQTDQRLEHDVSVVSQSATPWPKLVDAIVDQRGRIEMKPTDLEGRGVQHPFYRMTFVLAKINGAVDWYTGQPLASSHTTPWHSHHIFPRARPYGEGGYSPENHVDEQKVNEIANRGFLSADSNLKLQDTLPEIALAQAEECFPGALQKQFVPLNRELWKLEHYDAFLARRRELIATAYNQVMERLQSPAHADERGRVEELIGLQESGGLEFKSTLRWDMQRQQVNKDLQKVIAKTVAGFLNTEGGTLLIGVSDDGTVCGIEQDMKTLGKQNADGLELALRQALHTYLGPEFGPYCSTAFEPVDGHTVCRVEIDRSAKPVYLHEGPASEFYVRSGNSTQPLDTEGAVEYIGMHWES